MVQKEFLFIFRTSSSQISPGMMFPSLPSVDLNLQKSLKLNDRLLGSYSKQLISFYSLTFRRTLALTNREFLCIFFLIIIYLFFFFYRVLDIHLNSFILLFGFFPPHVPYLVYHFQLHQFFSELLFYFVQFFVF